MYQTIDNFNIFSNILYKLLIELIGRYFLSVVLSLALNKGMIFAILKCAGKSPTSKRLLNNIDKGRAINEAIFLSKHC